MPIQIVNSRDDDFRYIFNLGHLRAAQAKGDVRLEKTSTDMFPNAFEFPTKKRVYDFVRTARTQIREATVAKLANPDVLPGLKEEDMEEVREVYEQLFNYQKHKSSLINDGDKREESVHMLIFKSNRDSEIQNDQPYVAHVSFASVSKKTRPDRFEVSVSLSCLRFSYFPMQEDDFDAILKALERLNQSSDALKDSKPPEDINSDQAPKQIKQEKVETADDD